MLIIIILMLIILIIIIVTTLRPGAEAGREDLVVHGRLHQGADQEEAVPGWHE